MTSYELHALLVEQRSLIANTWQFFMSVHLALLGLAFVVRFHESRLILRTLMFLGYAGFMYINYMAQVDNYRYAAALLDYLDLGPYLDARASAAEQALRGVFKKGWILQFLPVIYVGSTLLGALAIYLPAFTSRRGPERDASMLVM